MSKFKSVTGCFTLTVSTLSPKFEYLGPLITRRSHPINIKSNREREKEGERETDRHTDRQRKKERE